MDYWTELLVTDFSLTGCLSYNMDTPVGKSEVKLSFQMWRIEEGKVTWPSPWPDSSWRPTRPSLGSGPLRDPVHPPALRDPACLVCRGWTDPKSCPNPPPAHIPLNHTSIPITPSTSCLLGPPPQVRVNAIILVYW